MASSQVEIAPTSPFGYVLRDRNQHDRYGTRDSNAFQKKFKDLVHNHLNSCVSGRSRNAGSSSGSNENSSRRIDYTDLWVHNPQASKNENDNHHSTDSGYTRLSDHSNSKENSQKRLECTDLWVHNPQRNKDENNKKKVSSGGKWDRARDMVFPVERKNQDGLLSRSVSNSERGRSEDGATIRPVQTSQKWRSQEGASLGPVRMTQRANSPTKSESAVEVHSLGGVSSLVQKWRDFAEAKSLSSSNSPICGSRCNSGLFFGDNVSFAESPARDFDGCDESVDVRPVSPTTNEDSFADWESCRTGLSGPPSSRGRNSDATESDRIRVADIIRKLSNNVEEHNDREHNVSHESLPRVRILSNQSEQRCFTPVSSSPRFRGRHAFNDLLMQMERERHRELEGLGECKAVSKFSYRGRIQAMLRIRFLRHGADVKDVRHLNNSNCKSSDSSRLTHSAIMHLREKFNSGVQHCGSDTRSHIVDLVNNNPDVEKSCASYDPKKEDHKQQLTELTNSPPLVAYNNEDEECSCRSNPVEQSIDLHELNSTFEQSTLQPHSSEKLHQEASSSSYVIQQETSSESCKQGNSELSVSSMSLKNVEENLYAEFQDTSSQHLPENRNESTNEISSAQGDWEDEEDNNQHSMVSDCGWVSDVSHPFSGWEELQSEYQLQDEINQDWISDVSRPRSTWEDLRQARYQEMLDPFIENNEIRHLLERKSVSNFLSSGMRERIDQLMMSRTQNAPNLMVIQVEKADKSDQLEGEKKEEGIQEEEEEEEKVHEVGEEEDEQEDDEEEENSVSCNDDYEQADEDIQIGQQHNAANYVDQMTSWVQDNQVSDNYSDPAASPSIEQSPLSNAYSQGTRPISPSIEMELIYQLRGNMEQLHQEIVELRRSIKSCMNMQMDLQQSIKQEVAAALCHSGRKKRRDSPLDKKSDKGRCCICYEMQIDSLLYRCGHMCTCFNCAHELQWGSGKCPICRAPIADVVRAYAHS